jgi:ketosteroid isomerase-like protein
MSRENVEIVRSIYAKWERGDYNSTDWQHPEVEFVMADGPNPGRWSGASGISEAWGDFLSAWEDFRQVADAYRDLDDERVLVLLHASGRGKTSGLEVEPIGSKAAVLFHIRDGRVTKIVLYFDRTAALEAVGLRE